MRHLFIDLPAVAVSISATALRAVPQFFWQEKHAEVSEEGEITPLQYPAEFDRNAYENGNDASGGVSQHTAWRHHP